MRKTSFLHGLKDLILSGWLHSPSNLQMWCNPYHNLNGSFYRNEKADPEIHMELQGNLKSLNSLEKRRTHASWFYNLMQSSGDNFKKVWCWHKDIHSMEWNWKSINKLIHLRPSDFDKGAETIQWIQIVSSINDTGPTK